MFWGRNMAVEPGVFARVAPRIGEISVPTSLGKQAPREVVGWVDIAGVNGVGMNMLDLLVGKALLSGPALWQESQAVTCSASSASVRMG